MSGCASVVPRALAGALVLSIGCGGAQVSGTFRGPNELDFAVTDPVQRQMPVEQHQGSAEVLQDSGQEMTLELRMLEGGDTCQVRARRTAPAAPGNETLEVLGGQQCRSRFSYEGDPVAAVVAIERGTVEVSGPSLRVHLEGTFVANTRTEAGDERLSGIARWEFEGSH